MSAKTKYKERGISLLYRFNEKDNTYKKISLSPVPDDKTQFFFTSVEGKSGDQNATKRVTVRLGISDLTFISKVMNVIAERAIVMPVEEKSSSEQE